MKKAIYKLIIRAKKNAKYFGLFLLLIFPLLIGLVWKIPLIQSIGVDVGDALAYYGVLGGICGSFATYRMEKQKSEKEKMQALKPIFNIKITRLETENQVFNIDITKISENQLQYLCVYDEFISDIVKSAYHFTATYNQDIETESLLKPDYNFTMDSTIIDSDGYPKYIQLLCDDIEGNHWSCCYYKVKDCDNIYYYPRDFEVL